MSHLGENASDLLDGRLPAAATELAHAHLARCASCREQVESLRLIKYRLSALEIPAPNAGLAAALMAIGAPSASPSLAPNAQWDHGPAGGRRPAGTGFSGSGGASGPGRVWIGRSGVGRRERRSSGGRRRPGRARAAAVMTGSFSLVGAGLLVVSVLSPAANAVVTPSANLGLARHMVTMSGLPVLNVLPAWRVARKASAP